MVSLLLQYHNIMLVQQYGTSFYIPCFVLDASWVQHPSPIMLMALGRTVALQVTQVMFDVLPADSPSKLLSPLTMPTGKYTSLKLQTLLCRECC